MKRRVWVLLVGALVCFGVGLGLTLVWPDWAGRIARFSRPRLMLENANPSLKVEFNPADPGLIGFADRIGIWDKAGVQTFAQGKLKRLTIGGKLIIRFEAEPLANVKTYDRNGKPTASYEVAETGDDVWVSLNLSLDPQKADLPEYRQQIKQDLTYLTAYVLTRISTKYGRQQQGSVNLVDQYLDQEQVVEKLDFIKSVGLVL